MATGTTAATTLRPQPSPQPVQATTILVEVPATVLAVDMSEAIRVRAYELWEQRGRQHGGDAQDWLEAETEILTRTTHDA